MYSVPITTDHLAYTPDISQFRTICHCYKPIFKTTCRIRALSPGKMGVFLLQGTTISICFILQEKLTKNVIRSKSVKTLLKITHMASRKSYLIIIGPNSHKTLTKSEIMSSWSQFKHCSKSLTRPQGIWLLCALIRMKS